MNKSPVLNSEFECLKSEICFGLFMVRYIRRYKNNEYSAFQSMSEFYFMLAFISKQTHFITQKTEDDGGEHLR